MSIEKEWTMDSKLNRKTIIVYLFSMLVILFIVLPFFLFGENSVVSIHDNLDDKVPWLHFANKNNYLFDINTPSSTADNLSTLYFAGSFNLYSILFYTLPSYYAYQFAFLISLIVGFLSMRYLLITIFGKKNYSLLILISLCFALVPAVPDKRISTAVMPLVFAIFIKLIRKEDTYKTILLLTFYPFFSEFSSSMCFICGFWILVVIIYFTYKKNIDKKIIFCTALLICSTILFNLRFFVIRFVTNEPLTRDYFDYSLLMHGTIIENFIKNFARASIKGVDEIATLHMYIILPVTFFLVLVIILTLINNNKKNCIDTIKNLDNKIRLLLFLLLIITFNNFVYALENSTHIIYLTLKKCIPPLCGLSFARLYVFNRVYWYIIFYIILELMYKKNNWKSLVYLLLFFQIFLSIFNPHIYQDTVPTLKTNILNSNAYIKYNEFYDVKLFNEIKDDINYNGEICVAFGYHPGVLLYNDFNTADAYISVYPYEDAINFQKLIQPELDLNESAKNYYIAWWGRRYLYNRELSYNPTREKTTTPVTLNIDIDVYKNHYNGKYIISRAPIINTEDLEIKLLNSYIDDKYFYNMWVYEVIY